jgi:hypothetical protein
MPSKVDSLKAEVPSPEVMARVKQRDGFSGRRIDSRQIRTLSEITPVAGQRQVARLVGSTMLSGNDVFHVVSDDTVFLTEQTVLTAVSSALPH